MYNKIIKEPENLQDLLRNYIGVFTDEQNFIGRESCLLGLDNLAKDNEKEARHYFNQAFMSCSITTRMLILDLMDRIIKIN